MGRYSSSTSQKPSSKQAQKPSSGLGCLMMLVIPAISIAAGIQTVAYALENQLRIIPQQLLGNPRLPDIVYKSSGLFIIFGRLAKMPNLYAQIAVSIVYMLLLGSLISLAYAVLHGLANPNRYGPTDAPPEKIRITKKSR